MRPLPRAGLLLAPLALMGLIFFLSAQPNLSSGLGTLDLIGRKFVHAFLFGLLCFLWWRALAPSLRPARALAAAILLTVLYALSDEYHQTFVEGRSGKPLDVLIDTAGALLAAALLRRGPASARQRALVSTVVVGLGLALAPSAPATAAAGGACESSPARR